MSDSKENTNIIQITPAALQELQKILLQRLEPVGYLRLGLDADGCSGYPFMLTFENTKTDADVQQDFDALSIVIAQQDIAQVSGVVIDYEQTGDQGKFVIDNPNRKHSCGGCGGSCGC